MAGHSDGTSDSASAPVADRHADRWRAMWLALSGGRTSGDDALRIALIARYGEPQRHYHTMQHLDECFAQFERLDSLCEHPAEVECALWFHDAAYDVRAHDNEAHSALLAATALLTAGVETAVRARINALILATRHDALPATADERVLIDVDLSILASPAARFAQYEQQVRQEYAWVPEPVYRSKRAEILQQFLDRDWIYGTAPMREAAESAARANLTASIRVLLA